MAKGFPYFKFIASEWLTGDIVFEDYDLQGIFINVCALYWHRDGDLTVTELEKRLKTDRLKSLYERFIKVDNDGKITIKFLQEQLIISGHISQINSANGKLGGRPKGSKTLDKKPTANRPLTDRKAKKSKEELEKERELKEYLSNQFNEFWKRYNKGSKKISRERFMNLTPSEVGEIQKHLPKYLANTPEVKFRKDAERYISHRAWETEITQAALPENWFNMDLTPEQMKLVPEHKRQEKRNHDLRRQMGI